MAGPSAGPRASTDPHREQAIREAVAIRDRRIELGQADRPWNTKEAMREWVKLRAEALAKERPRRE